MLNTSPGSPFENAMRQVPDLMDWLPMKYSEQFIEWVEDPLSTWCCAISYMCVSPHGVVQLQARRSSLTVAWYRFQIVLSVVSGKRMYPDQYPRCI